MDTHLIRGGCSRYAVLSALLPVVFLGRCCWAQATKVEAPFTLSCTPTRREIYRGQPLFLEVVLQNQSNQPQQLRDLPQHGANGVSRLDWRLQIAAPDGTFRDVVLSGESPARKPPRFAVEVPPGAAIADYLTIWFAAEGEIREELSLVFRAGVFRHSGGEFRYRIACSLPLSGDRRQMVAAEGHVKVTGRERGFSEMVSGLRGIMGADTQVLDPGGKKLDSLLAALGDSRYAKYVKWLRVRSVLTDGGSALRPRSTRARNASALVEFCEDLVASVGEDEPPILRDALAAKGIALAFLGQIEAAREVCGKLEAAFARTAGMAKLKRYVD